MITRRNNWLYRVVIITVLFSSFINVFGKEFSNNPTSDKVEEFQLPNYDTALDKINYSQPYDEIVWPWMSDEKKKEKHAEVANLLASISNTRWKDRGIFRWLKEDQKIRSLDFTPEFDEWCESYVYTPDQLTDDLLAKTFPYIPEIRGLAFHETNVSDQGLKNIYYLPLLQSVMIYSTKKITTKGLEYICKHPSLKHLTVYDFYNKKAISVIGNNAIYLERRVGKNSFRRQTRPWLVGENIYVTAKQPS